MSTVIKRSVSLSGHRTSYSIEEEFFAGLNEMASAQGIALARLIGNIDATRDSATNLSSALRVSVLKHYRSSNPIRIEEI
jgi:predicted DNA-binding ribbon-helix-helix protein